MQIKTCMYGMMHAHSGPIESQLEIVSKTVKNLTHRLLVFIECADGIHDTRSLAQHSSNLH